MNGLILWQGPSRIDGKPIVAILTGLASPSHNSKTGPMAQTWILRSDVHPHPAINNGDDISICGSCPLRLNEQGHRLCYVVQMPLGQIYANFRRGRYPVYAEAHNKLLFFRYGVYGLRIGSYGDPAAVPIKIWQDQIEILKRVRRKSIGWTGYTRRWMLPENQEYRHFLMASCFSVNEVSQALDLGWNTYRVKAGQDLLLPSEVPCPGSIERGKATTCAQCLMCHGTNSAPTASIAIDVHGTQRKHWGWDTITSSEPAEYVDTKN